MNSITLRKDFLRYKQQLADLCNLEDGLSEWEVGFVDEMMGKFKAEPEDVKLVWWLSAKQVEKIGELHAKHC